MRSGGEILEWLRDVRVGRRAMVWRWEDGVEWSGVWVVRREERFGVASRRGLSDEGEGSKVDVRSRVERDGKSVGLVREVRGSERRMRVWRLGSVVRGVREEREVMTLAVRVRVVRWGVGRGRGGEERLFEAREREVRVGKKGRRMTIYTQY